MRVNALLDLAAPFIARLLKIVVGLEVHPEKGCGAKETGEAERGVGRDRAALPDYAGDTGDGNVEFQGQTAGGEAKGLEEVLAERGSRMDRFDCTGSKHRWSPQW